MQVYNHAKLKSQFCSLRESSHLFILPPSHCTLKERKVFVQLGNLPCWRNCMRLVATWINSACVQRKSCANTARGCSKHWKAYFSVNHNSLSQFMPTMLRLLTPEIALPVLFKAASLAWHWLWSSESQGETCLPGTVQDLYMSMPKKTYEIFTFWNSIFTPTFI